MLKDIQLVLYDKMTKIWTPPPPLWNVEYVFYKNNAEKNGTFHMQIILKGGNKHAKIICDTCS